MSFIEVLEELPALTFEQRQLLVRRALELDPGFALGHSNLGNLYMQLGRHAEAEASCRRAVALKPDRSMLVVNRRLGVVGL